MDNIFANFKDRFIASLPKVPVELDLHLDEFVVFDSDALPSDLAKDDSDLLVGQGLPRDASPFLTFCAYSQLETKSRKETFGIPESCFPIGHNGSGDVLVVDMDTREIIYFNHDSHNARVLINASLPQFAESLCIYQEHLTKGAMGSCIAAIAAIDPRAVLQGSMWQAEVSSELANEA